MTEIQSALGILQLNYIKKWHMKEMKMLKIMNAARENKLFRVPNIPKHITHAFYKLYIFVNGGLKKRNKLLNEINKKGVPCYTGGCRRNLQRKSIWI